jgi:deoxyribodipyrimidine photolyase-related protein
MAKRDQESAGGAATVGSKLFLILGNQLFPLKFLPPPVGLRVFMAEDQELCTYFKFHKHKIILFLSAMRAYADELRAAGYQVDYIKIDDPVLRRQNYMEKLTSYATAHGVSQLVSFEIEDKFMERRLTDFVKTRNIHHEVLESPMFLTSRMEFQQYLKRAKKPFMKSFYEARRRELKILMDDDGGPCGGKFSFDDQNRCALPLEVGLPRLPKIRVDRHVSAVGAVVSQLFADHPGEVQGFWLPTTRNNAWVWFEDFLHERLGNFGPYEDALTNRHDVVFHSALSPLMNLGLLTPDEVIEGAISHAARHDVPMNSLEGFVRQVMGWREFVRGIYQNYSERQDRENFFGHRRKLADTWYQGCTGIPPLDDAIKKTLRLGWAHHIERLMVINVLMLVSGIEPREVHRWFMEMFVDSSDWVMGPNVYGMGQFSDGGIFATKPYICGSNYILKMSDYKKGPWCEEWDGLYWKFVAEKSHVLKKNPRLSMMVSMWQKKSPEQQRALLVAADRFIARNTIEP